MWFSPTHAQAVPANADIIYDAELIAIEDADETEVRVRQHFDRRRSSHHQRRPTGASPPPPLQARGDMLWEERMEAAEKYRQDGNALFTAGDPKGAAVKYLLVRAGRRCLSSQLAPTPLRLRLREERKRLRRAVAPRRRYRTSTTA